MFGMRSSIGLDIGSYSIKLVQLIKTKKGDIMLGKLAIAKIPRIISPSAISDPEKYKEKMLAGLLKRLFEENYLKPTNIAFAIPGGLAFIRQIEVLLKDRRKTDYMMRFEASQHIPFSLDEVAWDYHLLDGVKFKDTVSRAILVAIKKDLLDENINNFKTVPLNVKLVDVAPLALYNCVKFSKDFAPEGLVAILDIGLKTTNLILFKEDKLWIRSFSVDGDNLNLDAFAEELKRSLDYYGADTLDEILLCGGSLGRYSQLSDFLSQRFKCKRVSVLNPFKSLSGITLPNGRQVDIPCVDTDLPLFGIAMGLALRGVRHCDIEVNLLKETLSIRKETRMKKIFVLLSGMVAVLLVLSISYFMRADYNLKKARLNSIEVYLDAVTDYQPKIKKLIAENSFLEAKINTLYKLIKDRTLAVDALSGITRLLPKETWITEFSYSLPKTGESKIVIAGRSADYQGVNELITGLKSSSYFKDVRPVSSTVRVDTALNEEVIEFAVELRI